MDRRLLKIAKRICAADDTDALEELDQIKSFVNHYLYRNYSYALATKMEDYEKVTLIKIHRFIENLEKFVENSELLKQFKNYNEFKRRLHDFLKESVEDPYSDLLYLSSNNKTMTGDIDVGIYHLSEYCNVQKAKIED